MVTILDLPNETLYLISKYLTRVDIVHMKLAHKTFLYGINVDTTDFLFSPDYFCLCIINEYLGILEWIGEEYRLTGHNQFEICSCCNHEYIWKRLQNPYYIDLAKRLDYKTSRYKYKSIGECREVSIKENILKWFSHFSHVSHVRDDIT